MTERDQRFIRPLAPLVGRVGGRTPVFGMPVTVTPSRSAATIAVDIRAGLLGIASATIADITFLPLKPRRPFRPLFNLMAMTDGQGRTSTAASADDAAADAKVTLGGSSAARARRARQAGRPDGETGPETTEGEIDPDDLHRLVVEHSDAVYRLALSVVRDASLAEDVAQEALVKAWLALPTFRGEASLRSWLLRITHNTAISTLRRRRAVVLDPHDLPETQTRAERSVESSVQGHLVMDEFVEALDTLDELSRSIVVLRELEQLSYEEISEVLRVPMPTVKTRLLRARRRLGNVLRDWA